MQVQNQLRETVGMDLPLFKLFEHPTIRSLAAFVAQEKNQEPLTRKIQEWARRRETVAEWQNRKPFGARVRL